MWLSCRHRDDRRVAAPRGLYEECSQRIPVNVSFDGFPRRASLRKMGYLPALEGSTVPGAAMVNGSERSLAAADSDVCPESGCSFPMVGKAGLAGAPAKRVGRAVSGWGRGLSALYARCSRGVEGRRREKGRVVRMRWWAKNEGGVEKGGWRASLEPWWEVGGRFVPRRAPRAVALCELH